MTPSPLPPYIPPVPVVMIATLFKTDSSNLTAPRGAEDRTVHCLNHTPLTPPMPLPLLHAHPLTPLAVQ